MWYQNLFLQAYWTSGKDGFREKNHNYIGDTSRAPKQLGEDFVGGQGGGAETSVAMQARKCLIPLMYSFRIHGEVRGGVQREGGKEEAQHPQVRCVCRNANSHWGE